MKRKVEIRGVGFEVEAIFKEAIAKGSLMGTSSNSVQREFSSKMRLLRVDKGTIIIFTEPNEMHRVFRTRSLVEEGKKASETTAVRLYKEGKKKTKVEFLTKLELGKGISKGAVKARVERHLAVVTDAASYFYNLLGSREATEEDGKAFGEQLMRRIKKKDLTTRKNEVVKAFVQENKAFRELVEKHKFLEGLLCAVVWNRLWTSGQISSHKW
ncbi:hypothetical protein TrCOL_g11695 [Triparma columacea]|nr:hypothetical protein TrCOL_g11695 [Triparma columacea]